MEISIETVSVLIGIWTLLPHAFATPNLPDRYITAENIPGKDLVLSESRIPDLENRGKRSVTDVNYELIPAEGRHKNRHSSYNHKSKPRRNQYNNHNRHSQNHHGKGGYHNSNSYNSNSGYSTNSNFDRARKGDYGDSNHKQYGGKRGNRTGGQSHGGNSYGGRSGGSYGGHGEHGEHYHGGSGGNHYGNSGGGQYHSGGGGGSHGDYGDDSSSYLAAGGGYH